MLCYFSMTDCCTSHRGTGNVRMENLDETAPDVKDLFAGGEFQQLSRRHQESGSPPPLQIFLSEEETGRNHPEKELAIKDRMAYDPAHWRSWAPGPP
jgi:hypothetical protein